MNQRSIELVVAVATRSLPSCHRVGFMLDVGEALRNRTTVTPPVLRKIIGDAMRGRRTELGAQSGGGGEN